MGGGKGGLLGDVGDHGFGDEQEADDGGSVFQGAGGHFGYQDDITVGKSLLVEGTFGGVLLSCAT